MPVHLISAYTISIIPFTSSSRTKHTDHAPIHAPPAERQHFERRCWGMRTSGYDHRSADSRCWAFQAEFEKEAGSIVLSTVAPWSVD
jgi:hypothetical protein